MMGTAATNLAAPVTKTTSGILLLKTASVLDPEQTACIRCGRCIEVCPQGLQPFAITGYVRRGEYQEAKRFMFSIAWSAAAVHTPARQEFRLPTTANWPNTKYAKRNRTTPTMLKISTAPHFLFFHRHPFNHAGCDHCPASGRCGLRSPFSASLP